MPAGMRAGALAVIALAACGEPAGGPCHADSDCSSGEVCARDEECDAASDLRMVKVTWTISGMPVTATACAGFATFFLEFDGPGYGDSFEFEPVPCAEGQFTIDKIPSRFMQVAIGTDNGFFPAPIGADGTAAIDLMP